ncbi:hypothetical protein KR084_010539, partial [Drosophila pseudotakahashii]
IEIVPLIHVEDLKCRFQPIETELSCDFREAGYATYGGEKSYFLVANQMPRIQCFKKSRGTTIQCPGIPMNRTTKQYQLKIDMEYLGYNQSKEFQISLEQVLPPEWPTGKLHISDVKGVIHLWWRRDRASAQNLEWRVWFVPRNPRIQKHLIQTIVRFTALDMIKLYRFRSPPYAHQTYRVLISRRYPYWESPWSSEIETPDFITFAKIPDRPPDFLQNGFFHEPKQKNLFVYWLQLDELEFNGSNFTYYVITDRGKSATILSNNSAIFRDWDSTKPSKVTVWSQNSEGRSTNRSKLQVPILTDSIRHQPRNLWYHQDNQTIIWQPPTEQDKLIGYTVSWCSDSINKWQICDDHELIQFKVLDGSQHHFQFNGSMVLPNVAVAANYIDNTGGGIQWYSPRWIGHQDYEALSKLTLFIVFTVVVVLPGPIYFLFRKLQRMAQIEVELPDMLFKSIEPKFDPPVETAVPGNFPPKAVMNIARIPVRTFVEPDP